MEREKLESRLIDYIDGKLDEINCAAVEKELASNEEAFQLYEQLLKVISQFDKAPTIQPSHSLKLNLEKLLQEEINGLKKGRQVFLQPIVLRVAAGLALIMVGVSVGFWINKNQQQQQEIARLRQEMDSTKHAMMAMLDNRQSASQRVLGATVAYQMKNADDEIVNALIVAMNEDPNTNVRLAALEALSKFHHQEHVRRALIESLSKQKDPVVQISLIRLRVEMKEKTVLKELERMTKEKELLRAVKDEAYTGILKLS